MNIFVFVFQVIIIKVFNNENKNEEMAYTYKYKIINDSTCCWEAIYPIHTLNFSVLFSYRSNLN